LFSPAFVHIINSTPATTKEIERSFSGMALEGYYVAIKLTKKKDMGFIHIQSVT
jgi:hypothetical protein